MPLDPKVPHVEITRRILGAGFRVHNRLGPGLKEQHYQRAFTAEMRADGLIVEEEYALEIYDGEVWLGRLYIDHWVEGKVVVETEAFPHLLTNAEVAQVIGYLAATGSHVGLLINPSAGSGQVLVAGAWTISAFYHRKSWVTGRRTSSDFCGDQRTVDKLSADIESG